MIGFLLVLGIGLALMAISASASEERASISSWFESAFLGKTPAESPAPTGLEVRRQDYGELSLRKSVMNTPLKIGNEDFEHGLGTHSISQVVVHLPEPGERFEAQVGIDNNYDTAGQRGSVVFSVGVAGRESFRSDIRRGGDAPLPVRIELGGARTFILHVTDGGDGPGWDQSDWADASVILKSGKRIWLDELPVVTSPARLSNETPFSFTYGGKPSSRILSNWKCTRSQLGMEGGREKTRVTYTDPDTGLEVICDAIMFRNYPAIEWTLSFRNTGTADSPILQDVRPLDLAINAPPKGHITLHRAHGSTCTATDFLPIDESVGSDADINIAPNGGRSSDGNLPFFNLEWHGGGLVGAIGWSGQWSMRLQRDGGRHLVLQAGQQTTHLKLHPGESIRTPRMLLVMWQGDDRFRGHNLLRRLILDHYSPRYNGEILVPPVTQNTWFTFNTGNDVTQQNQLEAMRPMPGTGVEAYWLDAGWFEGGWPAGAGSWVPKKEAFPKGLKPLGDAAHKAGMKFVVWFEPERVNGGSRIAKEHPEWVLHAGDGDGLFNLGDPAAREWLTDFLSKCITDWGIDIYRNDFNIDPLRFWQASDAPDRQGMAEIRYIEGLYAMWDDLCRRHPGLSIDNCASGGRRIDLETISRSYPLWRSDTQCCGRAVPVQDQVQTAGLSLYVPLHATGVWGFDPYVFRSVATMGTNLCMDTRGKDTPLRQARQSVGELKALRPLYLGDYYPLLDINADEHQWCGWQFDRPELGKGFAMLFRRAESPYSSVDVVLRGLEPKATYEVVFVDSKKKRRMSGEELARLRVEIGSVESSVLVKYARIGK